MRMRLIGRHTGLMILCACPVSCLRNEGPDHSHHHQSRGSDDSYGFVQSPLSLRVEGNVSAAPEARRGSHDPTRQTVLPLHRTLRPWHIYIYINASGVGRGDPDSGHFRSRRRVREGLLAAIPLQGKGQVRVSRSPRTAARGRGGLLASVLLGQGLLPSSLLFFGQGFVLVLVSEDAVRHDRRPNEHYAYPVRRPQYPVKAVPPRARLHPPPASDLLDWFFREKRSPTSSDRVWIFVGFV